MIIIIIAFQIKISYLLALIQREFDIAICGVLRTPQMAKNGKNRLAILTIFCFRRTDVRLKDWVRDQERIHAGQDQHLFFPPAFADLRY